MGAGGAVTYFVVVFGAGLNDGFVLKLADLVGGVIPWACRWLADTRTCLYARSRIGKMELGLYGPRCRAATSPSPPVKKIEFR